MFRLVIEFEQLLSKNIGVIIGVINIQCFELGEAFYLRGLKVSSFHITVANRIMIDFKLVVMPNIILLGKRVLNCDLR